MIDELSSTCLHYQTKLEELQHALKIEKLENRKLKPEIENREAEANLFRKDLDNLKEVYEKKIETLNNKILVDKERIQDYKIEVKTKSEVYYLFSTFISN